MSVPPCVLLRCCKPVLPSLTPCVSRPRLQKRPVEDSDWRKNVEAMSGMEGRKKMFDAAKGPAQ